jgi:hypothetical protein
MTDAGGGTSDIHVVLKAGGCGMGRGPGEIDAKIVRAKRNLESIRCQVPEISAREFYDYMTAEIFSDDPTTPQDVLNNEYILVHELVEISELKKQGRTIDKRVIMETPKVPFYTAHLNAMEAELRYALYKRDTYWARMRLRQHKESVLDDDPNLPEELRPRATEIYEKYRKLTKEMSTLPVVL